MIFFLPLHKFFTMARHYNNKYKKKNQEINFVVREECELMEFLMKAMDGISRTKVKKLLTYDSVYVNDRVVSQHDFQLKPNMRVSIKKSSVANQAQGVIFICSDYSIKGSRLDRSLGLGRIMKHFKEIRQAEMREAQRLHTAIQEQESRPESKVRDVAAGLFEGNLGKSHEQDMKDPPKKKKGLKR